MVLHVTFHELVLIILALELAEDLIVALAQGVRQYVEATAVGHADDILGDAEFSPVLDHRIQCGNEGFGTFDAEPFRADELLAQEALEDHCFIELLQDLLLLLDGEFGHIACALHALLQPTHLFRIADILELRADALAVRLFQQGHDVTQLGRSDPYFIPSAEDGIQV